MKVMRIVFTALLVLSITQMAYAWGIDNVKTWVSDRVTNVKNAPGNVKDWGATHLGNMGLSISTKCNSWGDSLRANAVTTGSNSVANFFRNVGDRFSGAGAWVGNQMAGSERVKLHELSERLPYGAYMVERFETRTEVRPIDQILNPQAASSGGVIDSIKTWISDRGTNIKNVPGNVKDWGTNAKNEWAEKIGKWGLDLASKSDGRGDSLFAASASPGSNSVVNVLRNIGDRLNGVGAWVGQGMMGAGRAVGIDKYSYAHTRHASNEGRADFRLETTSTTESIGQYGSLKKTETCVFNYQASVYNGTIENRVTPRSLTPLTPITPIPQRVYHPSEDPNRGGAYFRLEQKIIESTSVDK